MRVYHGSSQLVTVPMFGVGKPTNDYGPGFYCTQDLELAKEWACAEDRDGFANQYRLDMDGLACLDLGGEDWHILNWLAVLLENRVFDLSYPVAVQGKKFILDRFLPPYKDFDVVIGYRADDSYYSFARAFLSNTISLEQLSRAMRLGKLGTQVVLRSPRAFEAIWKECSYPAPASIYHVRRVARDRKAREDFRGIQEETPLTVGCYLLDIIREDWNNEDPRLR